MFLEYSLAVVGHLTPSLPIKCFRIAQVVPVMLHLLTSISSVRLYIPKDLRPFDNRQLMLKSIQV